MTGSPTVNINEIMGRYPKQHYNTTLKVLDTNEDGKSDELGSIGTVFGGGNAAKVIGDTYVNVGTQAKNKHIGADDATIVDAGAYILENVYGGGNAADVTGKTSVTVGRE